MIYLCFRDIIIVSKVTVVSFRKVGGFMIYGYCRISTNKQNIERQVRNILAAYPSAIIVKEVYTGTKFQGRKELDKILKTIRPNDTIVFDSVSRMSRNSDEGYTLYEELFNKGITLVFLKEPHINTDTYKKAISGSIAMTGTNADYILEGIETARLNGKQIGLEKGSKLTTKKSLAAKEVIRKHNKDFGGSLSNEDTWKLAGISKMTFYKYKNELLAEG